MDVESRTSVSLLARLREAPADASVWEMFTHRYGPKIHAWCLNWGLQEADAQDVSQNVLLRLAERMRTFEYNPELSFRGWLNRITRNALNDFMKAGHKLVTESHLGINVLDTVEARDDLLGRLKDEFDLELLSHASKRVQERVSEHIWQAFELTAYEGLSGSEVARRLEMKVAHVYVAKGQVRDMLQEEVQRLEQDG